jgi:8-oxo-dGTP diphosphatase
MKWLRLIDLENSSKEEVKNYKYRKAARAVVFDKDGKIGLLHVGRSNYYKLPGGGVEEGEDTKRACERECEEEIGCDITIGEEIGLIEEYRKDEKLRQESFCYLAKVVGDKREPNLTKSEVRSRFKPIWVGIHQAIELIERNLREGDTHYIERRDSIFIKEVLKRTQIKSY